MLLITIFVELRVVVERSRTWAGCPQAVSRRPCCAVALRTAWSEHGMASVNQTWPQCVNQMGKTHSKPLAARHGRGTAWAWHAMCESAFRASNSTACSPYSDLRPFFLNFPHSNCVQCEYECVHMSKHIHCEMQF